MFKVESWHKDESSVQSADSSKDYSKPGVCCQKLILLVISGVTRGFMSAILL